MRTNRIATTGATTRMTREAFLERAIGAMAEDSGASALGGYSLDLAARLTATAMGTRWAFVSEVMDSEVRQLRLIALWSAPTRGTPFEYELQGTPCEQVLLTGDAFIPSGLRDAFPDFEWAREIGAESYMGWALYGSDQTLLGHIGVMHDEALNGDLPLTAILRIFRDRVEAELMRLGTEQDLRESEERFRRLVENSPDAIFRLRIRPTFAYEYVSPAYERISGYTAEELYQDPDLPLRDAHPDDREFGMRFRRGELMLPERWTRRWYARDGTLKWAEMRTIPIYDRQGNVVAFEGVGRDITELMETQQRLRDQEELQARVLAALPEQIIQVSGDGSVESVVATGWRGKTLARPGQRLADIIPREVVSELERQLATAQATGNASGISYSRVIGGQERNFEMRLVATPTDNFYCIIRDTTGDSWLKREAQLQGEREKLETNVERVMSGHRVYGLSFRELTVLHLVAQGETDRAIARRLGLSLYTVNKHVSNIIGKMGVASRTEASVRAASEGLLT